MVALPPGGELVDAFSRDPLVDELRLSLEQTEVALHVAKHGRLFRQWLLEKRNDLPLYKVRFMFRPSSKIRLQPALDSSWNSWRRRFVELCRTSAGTESWARRSELREATAKWGFSENCRILEIISYCHCSRLQRLQRVLAVA